VRIPTTTVLPPACRAGARRHRSGQALLALMLALLAPACALCAGEPPSGVRVDGPERIYFVLVASDIPEGTDDLLGRDCARVAAYFRNGTFACCYGASLRRCWPRVRIEAGHSVAWGPRAAGWTPESLEWSDLILWRDDEEGKPITAAIGDGLHEPSSGRYYSIEVDGHVVLEALATGQLPPARLDADTLIPPPVYWIRQHQEEVTWRNPRFPLVEPLSGVAHPLCLRVVGDGTFAFILLGSITNGGAAEMDGSALARVAVYSADGELACYYGARWRNQGEHWSIDAPDSVAWGAQGAGYVPDSLRWSWAASRRGQPLAVTIDDGWGRPSNGILQVVTARNHPAFTALISGQTPPARLTDAELRPR
jgi:hypothetical protein